MIFLLPHKDIIVLLQTTADWHKKFSYFDFFYRLLNFSIYLLPLSLIIPYYFNFATMSKITAYIQRYLFIIRFIRRNPYCTLQAIHKHVEREFRNHAIDNAGTSASVIEKDIREIRGLRVDIEYDRVQRGYYIPTDEYNGYSDIERILDSFDVLCSMGGDSGVPPYMLPEKRRSRGTEHLLTLKEAIKGNNPVRFSYKKFYPEESAMRTVEPYVLKESRGRWYLLGFADGDHSVAKSFGLDRIFDIQVLSPRKFTPQRNMDWEKKYEHCFAMFTDEHPEHVKIFVDHRDGNYINAMPIHPSQRLTRTDEGVMVELYISVTLDFIMELMSRSWSLSIIEPLSLRERMKEIYQEAEQRNS
ncbi:hypothetical protein EZS27_023031 [termite gut metagenome]|uniref:Uncharacterized protein n=1 Tax=termite gut metagenome TaxID=433724 RepID=A0A5J4R383_9ZZZZ